jgi:hypothetical protein
MRPDGDGRFCERSNLLVADVASLDVDGLERGQPRTKLGIAAGSVVMALAGCATPALSEATREPSFIEAGPFPSGGVISGTVHDRMGVPLGNAAIVLQSPALTTQQEMKTDENGLFTFEQLPPSSYTIRVYYDFRHIDEHVNLPANADVQLDFCLNPTASIPSWAWFSSAR